LDDRNFNPQIQDRWSQTLEALMDWLTLNESLSDAVVVRRMMDVIRHAPHPDLVDGLGQPDTATIEGLLAAGASDTLALRLIGTNSGFLASRGASGEYLVSLVLGGRGAEMTAAGPTLVRAVVFALALGLAHQDPGGPDIDHGLDHGLDHGYAGFIATCATGATLH
jgi:hypothetical protein